MGEERSWGIGNILWKNGTGARCCTAQQNPRPKALLQGCELTLSQFGCSSTKQLAGKYTSFKGRPLRLEKSLSLSNPGAKRDKDRENTLQCLEKQRLPRQFRAEHGQCFCGWPRNPQERTHPPLWGQMSHPRICRHLVWTHMLALVLKYCRALGIGSCPHPDIQQVKNTLILISSAPPVITELAGKAKRLHTWPFHCAAAADANRDIQGKRTQLSCFNPAKHKFCSDQILTAAFCFHLDKPVPRSIIQEDREDNNCNLLLTYRAAGCQLV